MPKAQKTIVVILVLIAVLIIAGIFGLKIVTTKVLNQPETKQEIQYALEAFLSDIIPQPKVRIERIKITGFSNIHFDASTLSNKDEHLLTVNEGTVTCSPFLMVIRGSCTAKVNLNFGEDGQINGTVTIPKMIFTRESVAKLKGALTIAHFNIHKLMSPGRKASNVSVSKASIEGQLQFSAQIGNDVTSNGTFRGALTEVVVEANVFGKQRQELGSIPLEFVFTNNTLTFERPLNFKLLGVSVSYAGDVNLGQSFKWDGTVKAAGKGFGPRFVPMLFRCRPAPPNPVSFRIKGPLNGATCR